MNIVTFTLPDGALTFDAQSTYYTATGIADTTNNQAFTFSATSSNTTVSGNGKSITTLIDIPSIGGIENDGTARITFGFSQSFPWSTLLTLDIDGNQYQHTRSEFANFGEVFSYEMPNAAPVITSPAAFSLPENTTVVGDVTANEPVAYSLSGIDAALFNINASGNLTFISAPNFESPADANMDNNYELTVAATDQQGAESSQNITISVTNVETEYMTTQTVIDTAAVSAALTNDLTLDSMATVIGALATAANNADIANKAELQNQINVLQTEMDAVQLAAERLENYELGQVEAILQSLVSSDGFQTLLQQATVTVNGQAMTLESVLANLLDAPKVASWDFSRGTDGMINGVLVNLTDGGIANMLASKTTVDDGLPTEHDVYTFSQANWAGKGFAASFEVHTIEKDIDFGGLFGLGSMGIGVAIKKQGNLLFDITGSAAGAAPTVVVPDANEDGIIGVPAP